MITLPNVKLWSDSLEVQRYWCPVDLPIPPRIWMDIGTYHVTPLRRLQLFTGAMFFPSKRSGYRPGEWERSKGRDGSSLHTFKPGSWGAVDLVMWNGTHVRHAVDLLVEYGPWRRICYYRDKAFVHVDYGDHDGKRCKRRQLFEAVGDGSVWSLRSYLAEPRV